MKLATWNLNGIRARETQLLEWMERERPDVLCVQETKASPEQIPAALRELGGHRCAWHCAGSYSGVGLLMRSDAFGGEEPVIAHPSFDREQRAVLARFGSLTIGSVYVPNGGKSLDAKLLFLAGMDRYVGDELAAGHELILAGDMNVTRTDRDVHPKELKPGTIGQRSDEREAFERVLSHGMSDVLRALRPDDENLFTWWAPWRHLRQRNIGWRIDYVLASKPWSSRAREATSQREFGTSDHAPVVVVFE